MEDGSPRERDRMAQRRAELSRALCPPPVTRAATPLRTGRSNSRSRPDKGVERGGVMRARNSPCASPCRSGRAAEAASLYSARILRLARDAGRALRAYRIEPRRPCHHAALRHHQQQFAALAQRGLTGEPGAHAVRQLRHLVRPGAEPAAQFADGHQPAQARAGKNGRSGCALANPADPRRTHGLHDPLRQPDPAGARLHARRLPEHRRHQPRRHRGSHRLQL